MTTDDIIRMAKEASGHDFVGPRTIEFAERFAALVAAHEREACAKVCDDLFQKTRLYPIEAEAAQDCADAIRARGET